MIYSLFLVAASALCPTTIIENRTEDWEIHDQVAYHSALKGCIHFYGENSCLKTFRKIEPNKYEAICRTYEE